MICRFAALKRKTNKNKEKNFLYIFAYFFLFFLYTPRRGMNRTKLFFYDY